MVDESVNTGEEPTIELESKVEAMEPKEEIKTPDQEEEIKTPDQARLKLKELLWEANSKVGSAQAEIDRKKAEADKLKADMANLEKVFQDIVKVLQDNEASLSDLKCLRDKSVEVCDDFQSRLKAALDDPKRKEIRNIRADEDKGTVEGTDKTWFLEKKDLVEVQIVHASQEEQQKYERFLESLGPTIQSRITGLANVNLELVRKQKVFDELKTKVSRLQADLKALEDLGKSIGNEITQGNMKFAYVYFLDFQDKLEVVNDAIMELDDSVAFEAALTSAWQALLEAQENVRDAEASLKAGEQELAATQQQLTALEKDRIQNIFDEIKAKVA